MKIQLICLVVLAAVVTAKAETMQFGHMPTLAILQQEAAKDPASKRTLEGAKNTAATGFTGENEKRESQAVAGTDDGTAKRPNSYHFKGNAPFKGVTIYTPEADEPGNEDTSEPAPEKTLFDWIHKPLLAVGAAATIGGFFFAPLLFLGGLLLGAGAILWYLNSKIKKR